MKKVLFGAAMLLLMVSCNSTEKKEDTSTEKKEDTTASKNNDMKALYEKNLSTLKASIAAFEKEDLAGQAALVADSARWGSPAYGDTISTKAHWMESLKYYMDNWSDLHLSNAQFLPGIDSATHEFDGSVRYYGRWDGTHSSGIKTKVNFYGTYDFNKDNKIIYGGEFFDLGGLMKAVSKGK